MTRAAYKCPACGACIIIAANWVGAINCPQCHLPIDRPAVGYAASSVEPATPLEFETRIDFSGTFILLVCLLGIALFGFLLLRSNRRDYQSLGIIVEGIVSLIFAFYVIQVLNKRVPSSTLVEGSTLRDTQRATLAAPLVLDYRTSGSTTKIRRPTSAADEAMEMVKVFAGIAGGLALMDVAPSNIPYSAFWVIPFAGVACLIFRGWRSVGFGLLLAVPTSWAFLLYILFANHKS